MRLPSYGDDGFVSDMNKTPVGMAAGGNVTLFADAATNLIQSDWSVVDSSAVGFIKSKPSIPTAAVTSGATSARPVSPVVGFAYFDTTVGLPIWWKGSIWINASGVTV